MNKEFRNNAFGDYCAFNDDGIVWHSNRPKQIIHLFFPYGSIDSIKFSIGCLDLRSQGKTYIFAVSGEDKATMKECIAFAQQTMLNAPRANVIEIDPLDENAKTPAGYKNNPTATKIEKSVEAIKSYFGGMETKAYKQAVASLPNMVASMADDEEILSAFAEYAEKNDLQVIYISAATGENVRELVNLAYHELESLPPIRVYETEYVEENFEAPDSHEFTVSNVNGVYVVEGDWLYRVMGNINFSDRESLMYFQRVLRNSGVIKALEEKGATDGDTVSIYDFEFDFLT